MATAIKSTNFSNYKAVRFPIHSDLNIDAWCHYLKDYPNKKLIEYLTYGFPLSLQGHTNLSYTVVTNHYSATQFPLDIQHYL